MASFQQRGKKGLWSVRFDIIENGKSITKRLSGYSSKREANNAYLQYLKDFEKHEKEAKDKSSQIKFSELYNKFFTNQKGKSKESTLYDLSGIYNLYFLPYFGDKYINEIKPIEILDWQNSLSSLSYNYKSKIRTYLNAIFSFAERYYDINNPMRKVESFRNTEPKKEIDYWSQDEFYQFLSVVDDEVFKTFFTALYVSGCRKGELLAVGINDIDINKSTLTISKSVSQKSGAPWKVVSPKNLSSNRTIYMPPQIIKSMVALFEHFHGEFIFCGDRPIPSTTLDRQFAKYCDLAGVKKIRIHDFRHSCASLLISKGVSIVAVSKRLGHSNIEQTLNTYSHMMPSDNEMMIRAVNDVISFDLETTKN